MRPQLAAAPELTTSRFVLRPWRPAEESMSFFRLIDEDRPRLTRDFPKTLNAVQDEASTRAYLEIRHADWLMGKGILLGIWPRAEATPLGFVSLRNIEWEVPKAELAYLLSARAEGRSVMHEAATAALHWAFTELQLLRVYCHVDPDNERSARLARRCGFRQEGLLRNNFRGGDGLVHDSYCFGLTQADWLARSAESA
ncbi:GNAT family N-acetyltransferase [Hymenobacter sp. CRA2]|uniref:GNAT family N-acetyltransferase n=1 Tax=Hymenobacter sp. CRA2 TaxID=1955620 RepID=UPI00098EC1C6|nr:GNAT family N-acetyltransferase [Hymenobacter sp. CRA2]OON67917.1 hypothetical protein B0919_14695 [Hymenobacter sp. CRA2]